MKKHFSDFKLPSVHFKTEIEEPESLTVQSILHSPLPFSNKLKLLQKYEHSPAKLRIRSKSELAFPEVTSKQQANSVRRRRKSKMIIIDMTKKQELDEQKKFLGSIKPKFSQQYNRYRIKYYKPQKIKEALDKIHSHKSNIQLIRSNLLREKCLNIVKNSIHYDPLLFFYKGSLESIYVIDQVFSVHQTDYDLAREILILQQKLHNVILAHRQEEIEEVASNINKYTEGIRQLRRKLEVSAGQTVSAEIQKVGKELERGDVKGLIRGFRLEQENMVDRINRNQKSLGKLIKNRLLLSESSMITKRHDLLKQRSVKTEQ